MSFHLIVHGYTEYYCLPSILKRFGIVTPNPHNLHGKGFGDNENELIKAPLLKAIELVRKRNPDKIIIVTDKERRAICPVKLASLMKKETLSRIEHAYGRQYSESMPDISFVIANSCYENWLIADPEGIFKGKLLRKKPNVKHSADTCAAIQIINECMVKNKNYDKCVHAPKLTALVDFNNPEVQKRSRSLRKFLKETGCVKA